MVKNMMKRDMEALEWEGMMSKQRKRGTSMSVSPALSDKNADKELKRLVSEMKPQGK